MKNFVKIFWCLAVVIFFGGGESAAQNPDAPKGIKVTLNAVVPTLDQNKKVSGVKEESFLQSVILPVGENNFAAVKVLVKSFNQSFKSGEYFRLTIENNSAQDVYVYINNSSPGGSCLSAIPTAEFKTVAPEKIASQQTIQSGIFQTTDQGGDESFVMLAALRASEVEKIFMASEFLTGVSRANSAPPQAVGKILESADNLELQQGISKSKSIDSGKIAITLGNVYSRSGKPLLAASFYDGLLQIGKCFAKTQLYRPAEYQRLIISWHNNRALANYLTGDLAKSKADYETSLELLKKLAETSGRKYSFEEAIILSNLAQVYATLGDQTEAIKRYTSALQILETNGDQTDSETRNRKAAVYNGLGTSHEFLKQFAVAENYYNQALEIQRKSEQKASEGITLNSLARLAMAQNNFAKAEKLFKESLALSLETGNQSGIASACNNLGLLYARQNKFGEARILFVRAAAILRGLRNRTALPNILSNLMYIEQKQNHPSAAILFGKQAIEILQEVRSEITGIEKDLQKSFVASREDIYRSLADILIAEGRFSEAQSVLGLLKEEEYFAYVRRDAGEIKNLSGKTDLISPADQKLIERYNLIADRVMEIGAEFQTLDDKKRKSTLSAEEQKRYDELSAQLADANAAFKLFLEKELAAEVGKAEKNDIENDRALQGKLQKWGAGTVALYTIMGKDRYRVILTTSKAQVDGKTEISAAELNKKIFAFRAALENPCACVDPRPLGKELYDILIKNFGLEFGRQPALHSARRPFARRENLLGRKTSDGDDHFDDQTKFVGGNADRLADARSRRLKRRNGRRPDQR
jgi:Flp pilus assembly protein TadD